MTGQVRESPCEETDSQDILPTKREGSKRSNSTKSAIPADERARCFAAQECLNRGLALHIQGKLHEALHEYRRALDLDASDAYGRYLAGLALKAIGRHRQARAEWQMARDLRALDEDSAWGLAMARKLLDSHL